MPSFSKVESLGQPHLDYILLALASTSDVGEIKESFQKFFELGISGEVIMEVMRQYKDNIPVLRSIAPFEDRCKGIRIADPAQQLRLLDELYNKCLEERTVNVTREGIELKKIELATAERCVEAASRIRLAEKSHELEILKLKLLADQNTSPQTLEVNSGPVVNIHHKREEEYED